jgi:dephospho-CoA kinase
MTDSNTTGDQRRRPMVVVLTGGIASGKTAVSDRLAEHGVPIIDTDVIARQIVEPGQEGLTAVVEAFGPDMLDASGRLDRAALRERVFDDAEARTQLERLLHPRIIRAAEARIAEHAGADYVVVVVPLFVETGSFADADRVVVVDVPESHQIERLMARDGVDRARAESMLAAQADRRERLAVADEVVDNSGTLEALGSQVAALHSRLAEVSRSPRRSTPRRR